MKSSISKSLNLKPITLTLIAAVLIFAGIISLPNDDSLLHSNGPKEKVPNTFWMDARSNFETGFNSKIYLQAMENFNLYRQRDKGLREGDLDKEWLLEGPTNIGGRVNVVTAASMGSDTIYAGAANGGVFRTEDGGDSWNPIFDFHAYMSVGAIAVDGDHIYVGTGDRNFGGGSYIGDGIRYSPDYGNTWQNIGPKQAGVVTDISLHPSNRSEIVIGSQGNPFIKSSDRGVYKTTDGGANWKNTLFVSDSSGVCNLIRDPNNPLVMYCSSYNRYRPGLRSEIAGPDSKIFKSIDGGSTWQQLTNGLPTGTFSRTGIAVASNNSNILAAVYVDKEAKLHDIYKSEDAGQSWKGLNASSNSTIASVYTPAPGYDFGWYFATIYFNPHNDNHIILPGVDMFQTLDGGNSWKINVPSWQTGEVHADKHDVEFLGPKTMIVATDGGLYKTTDNGSTWIDIENLAITQFYDISAASDILGGRYGGGAQDNGTILGNQNSVNNWFEVNGGDGFEFTPTYAGYDIAESQSANISMLYYNGNGGVDKLQFESNENRPWFTPYEFDSKNEQIVVGTDRLILFTSPPSGRKVISENLTRAGTEGLVNRRRQIWELELDPTDQDHLLAGTSDGLVWKGSVSAGMGNWTQINGDWGQNPISSVNHSTVDKNTFFVAITGYSIPYTGANIYKTTDGGQSWVSISGNLPNIGVNDLLLPENGNDQIIFAATDGGVFLTQDGGNEWKMLGTNLPTLTISEVELDLVNQKLIAGTFARSMWAYDVTFLELDQPIGIEENQMNVKVHPNPVSKTLHVNGFDPTTSLQVLSMSGQLIHEVQPNKAEFTIDCQRWTPGMYTLISNNQSIQIIKQ